MRSTTDGHDHGDASAGNKVSHGTRCSASTTQTQGPVTMQHKGDLLSCPIHSTRKDNKGLYYQRTYYV